MKAIIILATMYSLRPFVQCRRFYCKCFYLQVSEGLVLRDGSRLKYPINGKYEVGGGVLLLMILNENQKMLLASIIK